MGRQKSTTCLPIGPWPAQKPKNSTKTGGSGPDGHETRRLWLGSENHCVSCHHGRCLSIESWQLTWWHRSNSGKSQKGEWMNIGIYLMDPNGLQCIYIYKLICTFHQQYDIMDASGHFSQSMAIVYRDIMINNGIFFVYPIFRQTQNSKCKLVWLNLEIIHLLKLYLNDVQQNWRSFCYQVCLLSLFRLPKVWSKLCFFVVNTNVVVAIPRHIQDLWHRVNTWTKGRSTLSTFHYGYIYI
jgi:hypothetical protein